MDKLAIPELRWIVHEMNVYNTMKGYCLELPPE